MERLNKKRKILVIFCLVFILYIIWNTASICVYSFSDETCEADVAIVLGAATYDGEVSPVYRERLNHGMILYEQNYIEKIVVTGGYGEGNEESDACAAKRYLEKKGVPGTDIILEEESSITQENLENAKKLMDEKGYKTALIVSDPLHMRRAILLARDTGMETYSSPTTTTMYRSLRTKLPFLAREVFFYIGYQWYRIFF